VLLAVFRVLMRDPSTPGRELGLGQSLSILGREVREFRFKHAKNAAEFPMESL
jgi:hypothetical protein